MSLSTACICRGGKGHNGHQDMQMGGGITLLTAARDSHWHSHCRHGQRATTWAGDRGSRRKLSRTVRRALPVAAPASRTTPAGAAWAGALLPTSAPAAATTSLPTYLGDDTQHKFASFRLSPHVSNACSSCPPRVYLVVADVQCGEDRINHLPRACCDRGHRRAEQQVRPQACYAPPKRLLRLVRLHHFPPALQLDLRSFLPVRPGSGIRHRADCRGRERLQRSVARITSPSFCSPPLPAVCDAHAKCAALRRAPLVLLRDACPCAMHMRHQAHVPTHALPACLWTAPPRCILLSLFLLHPPLQRAFLLRSSLSSPPQPPTTLLTGPTVKRASSRHLPLCRRVPWS